MKYIFYLAALIAFIMASLNIFNFASNLPHGRFDVKNFGLWAGICILCGIIGNALEQAGLAKKRREAEKRQREAIENLNASMSAPKPAAQYGILHYGRAAGNTANPPAVVSPPDIPIQGGAPVDDDSATDADWMRHLEK